MIISFFHSKITSYQYFEEKMLFYRATANDDLTKLRPFFFFFYIKGNIVTWFKIKFLELFNFRIKHVLFVVKDISYFFVAFCNMFRQLK